MEKQNSNGAARHFVWAVIVGIAMIVVIIYSKSASTGGEPGAAAVRDSLSTIAVPDTTFSSDVLPAEPETIIVAMPDTIGKDKRPASEAGYEDGYLSGMDDGATGNENATYDETNSFPTRREREAYVENYRKGYADGLEDGKNGRQFNISAQ